MSAVAAELSASLEDYLEAIYQVMAERGETRGKDIADRLGVAASSVTNALQGLARRDLIHHEPYDLITLTEEGKRVAEEVVRRHEVLTSFFTEVLAVDETTAADCACKMEHIVGDVILERLIAYIEYNRQAGNGHTAWVAGKGFVQDA
jgi:DtxR family Mn-dependent transcriptional regulator